MINNRLHIMSVIDHHPCFTHYPPVFFTFQTTPHLLPVAFQDIYSFMSSSRHSNPKFKVYEVSKDMNGFHENCSGIAQPHIYFSKGSIWHGGAKKTGTLCFIVQAKK